MSQEVGLGGGAEPRAAAAGPDGELGADGADEDGGRCMVAEAFDAAARDGEALGDLAGGELGCGVDGGGAGGGGVRGAIEEGEGERGGGGIGEVLEGGLAALERELFGDVLEAEAGKRRLDAREELGRDDAEAHEVLGAARLVAGIERDAVVLLLPEHVPEGALEMALVMNEADVGRLERRGQAQVPPKALLDVVGEAAGFVSRAHKQRVGVRVGEAEGEEAAAALLVEDACRAAARLRGAGEHLRALDAHDDVMTEGAHALFVDTSARELREKRRRVRGARRPERRGCSLDHHGAQRPAPSPPGATRSGRMKIISGFAFAFGAPIETLAQTSAP